MRGKHWLGCGLVAAACLGIALSPGPAPAFVDYPALTLGHLCGRTLPGNDTGHCTHIFSVSVEKVDNVKVAADNGREHCRVFFRKGTEFKGKQPADVMCLHFPKDAPEAQRVVQWAEEGKKTVMFVREGKPAAGSPHINYVYIDSFWFYMYGEDEAWKTWMRFTPTPLQLRTYCGRSDKLVEAVGALLAGKEVVVPCMTNGSSEDLRLGKTKVQRVKTKLNDVAWDGALKTTFVGWGFADENNPSPSKK